MFEGNFEIFDALSLKNTSNIIPSTNVIYNIAPRITKLNNILLKLNIVIFHRKLSMKFYIFIFQKRLKNISLLEIILQNS